MIVSATITSKDGGLELLDGKANIAGRRFSGVLMMTPDGRMQADLETDLLDARDVFSLAFMPLQGEVRDLATGFVDFSAGGIEGEIFLRPIQFDTITGATLREVVIGIGYEKDARLLNITSAGEQGPNADLRMQPQGAAQKINGPCVGRLILARSLPMPLVKV